MSPKPTNQKGRKYMLYELLFGYEGGCDEWTKAEGNDVRDVVIDFFDSLSAQLLKGPRGCIYGTT